MTDQKYRSDPERNHNGFHESLSAAIPNRTYRSQIQAPARPSVAQAVIGWVATILAILLALRFAIELFTTSRTNAVAATIFALTDWAVSPFQAVFGGVPYRSDTMGTFDWSTIAAIVAAIVISWIVLSLLRPKSR